VSVHAPLQFVDPAGHEIPHAPNAQTCPVGHAFPHAPQLAGSDAVLRHTPLQFVVPAGHAEHVPLAQV
jgi:hypothetical protein